MNRYLTAILSVLLLLLASGCEGTTVFKPTEVDVPVETSCQIDVPPAPKYSLPVQNNASLTIKTKAMITDLQLSKDYIAKLLAAEQACNIPVR